MTTSSAFWLIIVIVVIITMIINKLHPVIVGGRYLSTLWVLFGAIFFLVAYIVLCLSIIFDWGLI